MTNEVVGVRRDRAHLEGSVLRCLRVLPDAGAAGDRHCRCRDRRLSLPLDDEAGDAAGRLTDGARVRAGKDEARRGEQGRENAERSGDDP